MNILIVEDDLNKIRQLADCVAEQMPGVVPVLRHSYQSGLKEALCKGAEVMILDMTMPTYDISTAERGGDTKTYAGVDILSEIARNGLKTKVIIVTQFESFGQGPERKTLRELEQELEKSFSANYVGTVFYQASESKWRTELSGMLKSVTGGLLEHRG